MTFCTGKAGTVVESFIGPSVHGLAAQLLSSTRIGVRVRILSFCR